jgi:hypothetical protein
MLVSLGWLGSPVAVLTVPDMTGVTGWSASFLPASSNSAEWLLIASGANAAAKRGACTENARYVTAYANGSR